MDSVATAVTAVQRPQRSFLIPKASPSTVRETCSSPTPSTTQSARLPRAGPSRPLSTRPGPAAQLPWGRGGVGSADCVRPERPGGGGCRQCHAHAVHRGHLEQRRGHGAEPGQSGFGPGPGRRHIRSTTDTAGATQQAPAAADAPCHTRTDQRGFLVTDPTTASPTTKPWQAKISRRRFMARERRWRALRHSPDSFPRVSVTASHRRPPRPRGAASTSVRSNTSCS